MCWLDSEAFCEQWKLQQMEEAGVHCWPKENRKIHFTSEDQIFMCYMHTHVYTHGTKVYFKRNILDKSSQMSPIPSNAMVYSELLFPECVMRLIRATQGIQATLVLMLHLQCGCVKANKHRDGIQHLCIKMVSWIFSRGKLERDFVFSFLFWEGEGFSPLKSP